MLIRLKVSQEKKNEWSLSYRGATGVWIAFGRIGYTGDDPAWGSISGQWLYWHVGGGPMSKRPIYPASSARDAVMRAYRAYRGWVG